MLSVFLNNQLLNECVLAYHGTGDYLDSGFHKSFPSDYVYVPIVVGQRFNKIPLSLHGIGSVNRYRGSEFIWVYGLCPSSGILNNWKA
jgi:hypothetical protein